MKYKRVNKYDFSTPGSESTVFETTSRLDEGKVPSCVYVPATVILVLENSSAKEASLSGKGWDKDLGMEMEMKTGRAPELLGRGQGGEGCCGAQLEADYLQGGAQHRSSWGLWGSPGKSPASAPLSPTFPSPTVPPTY